MHSRREHSLSQRAFTLAESMHSRREHSLSRIAVLYPLDSLLNYLPSSPNSMSTLATSLLATVAWDIPALRWPCP